MIPIIQCNWKNWLFKDGDDNARRNKNYKAKVNRLVKEMGILLRKILAGLLHTITNVGTVAKNVIRVMGVDRSSQKRHLDIRETGPSLMREIRERGHPMLSQG